MLPYRIELSRNDVGAGLLSEFKDHLRVSGTAQDTDLKRYLNRAARDLEDDTSRLIVIDTVVEWYDTWPWDWVRELALHRAPVTSLTKIEYYDTDGVLQEWASSNYQTDLVDEPARIAIADGATLTSPALDDRMNPVKITYESGLVDADADGVTVADLDAQTKNALFVRGAWLAGPGRELMPEYDPVAVARCWESQVRRLRWTL